MCAYVCMDNDMYVSVLCVCVCVCVWGGGGGGGGQNRGIKTNDR